jgi:RES domain-containing protein
MPFAGERGGRWNPPGSFPALYLNGDPLTVLLQIRRMLRGTPVRVDDLDEDAFFLVAATLPRKPDGG